MQVIYIWLIFSLKTKLENFFCVGVYVCAFAHACVLAFPFSFQKSFRKKQ